MRSDHICYDAFRMIAHLRGTIGKLAPGEAVIDVQGVGYGISMPLNDWDGIMDGASVQVYTHTYVREDRLELFGFVEASSRALFRQLIQLSGIGPRMGLELCGVPRSILFTAVQTRDPTLLQSVKGVGKKSAEKLLVELTAFMERDPTVFAGSSSQTLAAKFDQDTIAALSQLGFATQDILRVLEGLPTSLASTEERVTAALRSL